MTAAGASVVLLVARLGTGRRDGPAPAHPVPEADGPASSLEERLLGERVDVLLCRQPSLRYAHRRLLVEDCLRCRPRPRGKRRDGGRPRDVPTGG
ncbi:MAG: hypothetical protein ACLPVF_18165 [Acidimicrobiales bacterium]